MLTRSVLSQAFDVAYQRSRGLLIWCDFPFDPAVFLLNCVFLLHA